ncbi:stage V sporulation protein AE [Bacillus sp. JCM 19046]|uniref:Stage V sporulation protein AE n=1 Tax=Shouchella xiaoxiensis TaxID=766895 RepID=A0ABS2SRT7_9BACI|nr:stage V sporulation protein AE [Shouchella xiaoxiensis]MBM7838225.1 stage V sporulation protein AE [Shouchella xiaoxiensis]GAF12099.1 stage V sporulation protein AE [Bacillus sp. JCM 19045]GAF17890.1 stage V sporulation protein AE [Bacillus sp. JCM 19046]
MDLLYAFLIGGAICLFGQLLLDIVKLTPISMLIVLVLVGVVLDGFGLYEHLIALAGAGATVPLTGFGYSLVHGAMEGGTNGLFFITDGVFEIASITIVFSILFSVGAAVLFKPKGVA